MTTTRGALAKFLNWAVYFGSGTNFRAHNQFYARAQTDAGIWPASQIKWL